MEQKPEPIQTIAMAEYALDLGIPIVKFVVRLHLAETEAEAQELISGAHFFINDTCITSLDTIIRTKNVAGGAIIKAGEKQIKVIIWVDGD